MGIIILSKFIKNKLYEIKQIGITIKKSNKRVHEIINVRKIIIRRKTSLHFSALT